VACFSISCSWSRRLLLASSLQSRQGLCWRTNMFHASFAHHQPGYLPIVLRGCFVFFKASANSYQFFIDCCHSHFLKNEEAHFLQTFFI
jgi:hypothetical protein